MHIRYMKAAALLFWPTVVLASGFAWSACFANERQAVREFFGGAPAANQDGGSSYVEDVNGLHRPAAFVEKAQPTVPPPYTPPPDPPKKTGPDCATLCGNFSSANSDCGSYTTSCKRYLKPDVDASTVGICRQRDAECAKADRAQARLGSCDCSKYE